MHVLLVEDDVPTARTMEQALESRGYTCKATGLGEDAVELAKKQEFTYGVHPDHVLVRSSQRSGAL